MKSKIMTQDIKETFEYQLVYAFYNSGQEKAERSGVPKINHIDEGLRILEYLEANHQTKLAWCLHPCFQDNKPLFEHSKYTSQISGNVMLYVLEYRYVANSFLCRPETDSYTLNNMPYITIPEVKQMLIADKVQNKKDFMAHHYNVHPRSEQLYNYFNLWLTHLGITENEYNSLCKIIEREK